MLTIIKEKLTIEKRSKELKLLSEMENKIISETKISKEKYEKYFDDVYFEFIKECKIKKINSFEFSFFESVLKRVIKLSEATTTSDVAMFVPKLGFKPAKRKTIKGLPVYEATWNEFKYFVENDERFKDQEQRIDSLMKDENVDDNFKSELLKNINDTGAYLKYINLLVKLNKQGK